MPRRVALLIVTDTYTDAAFSQLRAPRQDAHELADVLGDDEIGGYQVTVLSNQPSHEVRIRIAELFSTAGRDDLILLYVSGHGVKDESGHLFLAATDTRRNLLAATALPAQFVRELIDHSPARKVVVWLDCCYAGAFPAGMIPKAEGQVDVLAQLTARSGRGCAVMTASTHIQYAFERGAAPQLSGQSQPSVFTSAIVEGLRTGAADLNADGEIDAAELYAYVYDRVKATTPDQTPTRNDQVTGELYIARSKHGMRLHPDLPTDIKLNLRSRTLSFQLTAVRELAELARTGNDAQRTIATDTLRHLRTGPEPRLARAAAEAAALTPPSRESPATASPAALALPEHGIRLGAKPVRRRALSAAIFGALLIAIFGFHLRTGLEPLDIIGTFYLILFAIWPFFSLGNYLARTALDQSVILLKKESSLGTVLFRPDGTLLVCSGPAGVTILDTATWTSTDTIPHDDVPAGRAAFSPDGVVLAVAFKERVTLWDSHAREVIGVLDAGGNGVLRMAFSPDGTILATGHRTGVIKIWRTADWSVSTSIRGQGREVRSLSFSPDGTLLASTWQRGLVKVWDTTSWTKLGDLVPQVASRVMFSPNGSTLIVSTMNGVLTVWNTKNWTLRRRLNKGSIGNPVMAFSPDGALFAECAIFTIKVWETTDWSRVRTLRGHYDVITSLAFSSDGSLLASTAGDGTLRLWKPEA